MTAQKCLNPAQASQRYGGSGIEGYAPLAESWVRRLADEGRLLVRYSGTELLLRVMVEGSDPDLVNSCAEELVAHLSRAVGDGDTP